MLRKLNNPILYVALAAMLVVSCSNDKNGKNGDNATANAQKTDSTKSNLLQINGKVFSIPSPIQTALLIKKIGATYTPTFLNAPKKATNYVTNSQKALNLGIYGADLGYVTIYNQTQDAISYLTSVNQLADELGVTGAFNHDLVERFQKSLGSKDSLLALVSDAYKSADSYLKDNKRNDISSMVLAGGWIETLYLAVEVAKKTNNQAMIDRIGEQKESLDNLIHILTPYKDQANLSDLLNQLTALQGDFANVKTQYEYVAPTTDVANRTTTINSKTSVVISKDQLATISQKVEQLRANIIGK